MSKNSFRRSSDSVACTIVSANYLAYAATLRDSLKETDSDVDFVVLVVDTPSERAERYIAERGLTAIWLQDIGVPDLTAVSFRYGILELNTNVKPHFLRWLLERGYELVVYCDPDTYFYSSLRAALADHLERAIMLTPHLVSPANNLGDELPLLKTGVFNLGFVAVTSRPEARQFLTWWSDRCLAAGFEDTCAGQYVDQKWIDFVPCFFSDYAVIRDPAFNVAYWNIHERLLEVNDSRPTIAGDDLVFFHFSGLASDTAMLSRHRALEASPSLVAALELAEHYRIALQANGHSETRSIPYGFGAFSDGAPILPIQRIAYHHCRDDPLTGDPFEAASAFGSVLRRSRLWQGIAVLGTEPGTTTSILENLEAKKQRLRWLMEWAARALGPVRYWYLVRYVAMIISPLEQRDQMRRLLFRRQRTDHEQN